MPDRMDRAQLGEQVSDRDSSGRMSEESMTADPRSDRTSEEGLTADPRRGRDSNMEEISPRESASEENEDLSAGDEGIDDANVRRSASERSTSTRRDSRSRDVRERGEDSVESEAQFTGRGGQKEGSFREAEGTGYTADRKRQLQEDDSKSGTQGRHGKMGNRHGDADRVGGQTAQNPRGRNSKVDRSKM
jgi:hypothetical protein